MAHFAKVVSGRVRQVIVAEKDVINSGKFGDPSSWIQTSYNTFGGVHKDPETSLEDDGTPLRKNFASVGYIYDSELDAFYAPQPYKSWTLNKNTCLWEPPISYPDDNKIYKWDEDFFNWVEITPQENI